MSDGRKSKCLILSSQWLPRTLPSTWAHIFAWWWWWWRWWQTLGAASVCLSSSFDSFTLHFSGAVSSAPRTFLGAGCSVNTPNKRAFSRVGAGDDLTPVMRLRNYSYFSLGKPGGVLSNVNYYVQRVFYETICQKALLWAANPGSHWPPAFLPLTVPAPLLPLQTRFVSCLRDGALFVQ